MPSYGAVPLLDAPLTSLLPLATIEAALKKAGKPWDYMITWHVDRAGKAVQIAIRSTSSSEISSCLRS